MKISNITKKFDRFSLNWQKSDCFENKVYGIIGANGCGKTTMMKIIAGLIAPDGGEIDYGGLTPRDITMVFRKPYLIHDSVYKNLIYPLSLRKTKPLRRLKPDEKQVEFYLKMAGLENMRDQYALSLSSGEQQKLSFVRAMIFSPKLILIDEAFSNMDIESVARFEEHILEIQRKEPVTWIVISHQLSNIKRLCDYVYFMHDGAPEAWGTADEILLSPKEPNLKRYLHNEILTS
ncbi:MAG: ABC transporter ATP-binding protein [Defluviitaleaceae bacterium]|nr:ABC transporter ATP-binding protein [Defluviitaleaceae bacterium]